MKKRKMAVMASALVIAAASLAGIEAKTAYAVEGWTSDGEEWKYLDDEDNPVRNVWRQSRDAWFYLGSDGVMKRDCFVEDGSGLYYVDEEGKRVENDWVLAQEDEDSGYEAGWYYFGGNGKAYRKTSTPRKTIGGKTYMFDENGRMLTGWFDRDGEPLDEDDDPMVEGECYAGEDGALLTEAWLDYSEIDPYALDDITSSISGRDYNEYDRIWLYFNNRSKKVRSKGDRLVQRNIDGVTYGFDEYGIMLPWWSKAGSVSNADKSNPSSELSARFYAGYDGGKLLKDSWFWMYPEEGLAEDDSNDGEYSWWHTDQNGEVYRDRIKKINGRRYAFDGLGRMQTGFVLFDGSSTFVAQYDPDVWSSQDFKDGNLYGGEKADLYFFSPDELNDGSMQTGDEVSVELADGVFTFGFKSNGIAYGSRNELKRVKDSYYINGLRLEADQEFGYGVVQDEADTYRVVNTRGKTVSGSKKVLEDGDGGWILVINGQFAARVDDEHKPKWHNGPDGPGFYHYDPDNKTDKYAGGIIAGPDTPPDPDGLLDEEKLNFE